MTQLKKIEIFDYTQTFTTIGKKESVIIKFTDEHKNISYGEASPLPGRSFEKFNDVKQEIFAFCKALLSNQAHTFTLSPSVMFATTSALLPLQKSIEPKTYQKRELLITNSTKPDLSNFKDLLKVKVKGLVLHQAIDLCKYLIDQGKSFCIDCNQAFSLKEMLFFSKHFTSSEIQYLEEPVFPFTDLITFSQESPIPIAIDESLYTQPIERIKALQNLKLIVLKPTLIGGVQEHLAVINKCKGIACTLSSSYESTIGINNIITLSHLLNIKEPLGIDTCRYAKSSVLIKNSNAINEKLLCPILPK